MPSIIIKGNIEQYKTISRFKDKDIDLIGLQNLNLKFDPKTDHIEYTIYDPTREFISIDYNYTNYKLPSQETYLQYSNLEIDPIEDIKSYFDIGEFKTTYSFFRKIISNNEELGLFIKDISPDRTELKVSSLTLNISDSFKLLDNSSIYLKKYLLNFGNNNVVLFINQELNGDEIFIKLYEPLPNNFNIGDTCYIVEEISNSLEFDLNLQNEIIPDPSPFLNGPNFNVDIDLNNTISTKYESINSLLNYTGSSLQSILNKINLAEIEINVDYTDFINFNRFGSTYKRLNNFYNKVKQIEDYNSFITQYGNSPQQNILLQVGQYSASINNIVLSFDGYENYLYFTSNSYSWPKSNLTAPYILESTGSSNVQTWFTNITDSAIYYDNNNLNKLSNLIPEYILVNSDNEPYINFVDMMGHYFDNIWIYIKAITDLFKSTNNIDSGVSKDLVILALQNLGVKIYNTKEDEDLYNYIIGNNNDPSQNLIAELYKRLYHNVTLLYKSKGSHNSLQNLITLFGITSSILNVKEYGGNTNNESSLIEHNNDKIKIVNNTLYSASYGSILHPYISLNENTYDSYKNDNDRVDIAFSPQNQLDLSISSSISILHPTFSIDEYIGNPQYETSSYYGNLNNIRYDIITASFAYNYDYRGFIELIKYFDNTLFKMVNDYVPAKSKLSEGIVIRQQALERIKWKRYNPDISNQDVHELNYSTASITSQYDDLFEYLSGSKIEYYNGEISGSFLDIYNTNFIPNNINPWALTNSLNNSLFLKSEYNVLLNNVSSSLLSIRKKLEKKPYSSQSLLVNLEVQDYHDKSWNDSRYNGVKISGQSYNIYTEGDDTIDKLPVISSLDCCVFELEWGGGGYPENTTGGGLRLGNIIIVGETKDDITKLEPGDPVYHYILEKNIPHNLTKIIRKPYSPGGNIPVELNIAYSNLGLPNASYYLGSGGQTAFLVSTPTIGDFYISLGSTNKPTLILSGSLSAGLPTAIINSQGHLEQSYTNTKYIYETIYDISSSLENNQKWFISLYSGSGNSSNPSTGLPLSASGVPLNQYGHPFEIEQAYTSSIGGHTFSYLVLKTGSGIFDVASHFSGSANVIPVGFSQSKATTGLMLTKADYPNNGITLFNYGSGNYGGVGKGYIFLPYKKEIITNNIDYIIQKYSINPT